MQAKRGKAPTVQRPMILDVLPASVAPRLDVLPQKFRRKIAHLASRASRHWRIYTGVILLAIAATAIVWRPWQAVPVTLPSNIANEITDFTPYYFEKTLPVGLSVDAKTLTYASGILFFQVRNQQGDSAVVSEQALPDDFKNGKPQGDQTVGGVDGTAAISSRDGRIIGNFITAKKPAALISLNAAGGVDPSMLKKILQALKPIN